MEIEESALSGPLQGVLLTPRRASGLGVVVLGGSSGSINVETGAPLRGAASIPVETSRATFVLVAGADDALWPSDRFAASLAERFAAAGNRHFLLTHRRAGHRIFLPGETAARSPINAHGGTDDADRELGRNAWKVIAKVCGLTNE